MSQKQEQKKATVALLKNFLEGNVYFILAGFQGLSVEQVTALRRSLRAQDATFQVVKNTLMGKALTELGKETYADIFPLLEGPTALISGGKDAAFSARTLVAFQKENETVLTVKIGALEKTILTHQEIITLAKLPSREVMLGRVAGQIAAPLTGLVNVLQGTIRKLVYALEAIRNTKEVSA